MKTQKPYLVSKTTAEHYLRIFLSGLLVTSTFFGPSLSLANNACDVVFEDPKDNGRSGKPSEGKSDRPATKPWDKGSNAPSSKPAGKTDIYKDLGLSWKASQEAISLIKNHVYGSSVALHALLTGSIAKEFVWVNGDPGGAKTFLARLVFDAQLKAIPEKDKRVFLLQFHQLMSEGVITGFPKVQALLKDGKYEIETSTSLMGDRFLFAIFDEAEKANTATLASLLSVLNERKAFLGSKTVYAALVSGVFTSNKTMAGFVDSFEEDRPTGEALADRMGIKVHTVSQMPSYQETIMMYNSLKSSKLKKDELVLPLHSIADQLVAKIEISPEALADAVKLVGQLDGVFTPKADQTLKQIRLGDRGAQEYFPANQFSNRSARRLIKIWKSAFIAQQLEDGIPFDQIRTTIERRDLHLLSVGAIYNGPSVVRFKHVKVPKITVQGFYGEDYKVDAEFDPYRNELKFTSPESQRLVTLTLDLSKGTIVKQASEAQENEKIQISEEAVKPLITLVKQELANAKIDLKTPQYEVDNTIERLLSKATFEEDTRIELQSIYEDGIAFTQQLNAIMMETPTKFQFSLNPEIKRIESEAASLQKGLVEMYKDQTPTVEERMPIVVKSINNAFKELTLKFKELEHSVTAHFVAILSGEHIYSFGPPGGAKTALAQTILDGILKQVNEKDLHLFKEKMSQELMETNPGEARIFFLQFHKMVPEGVIVGFPKIQSQIDTGKTEYDFSTSIADRKFLFAILDEVEKGNPAVLTALLAVLNEREVFAGNTVQKAALRTAVLTSNKVPSEFLDSFGSKNRPTGKALMDRTLNKNYVSNKFSEDRVLAEFLSNLEKGVDLSMKSPLPIDELRPLIGRVKMEEHIQLMLAKIHEGFMKRRLEISQKSHLANREDYAEYPDYYVMSSSPSNRTFIRLMDQFKAHFILDQVKRGVAYEDMNYEVKLSDLHLFLGGMGYWGPFKIAPVYDNNGILRFELDTGILGKLKDSPRVNTRNKYVMNSILEEARDFTDIANSEIHDLLVSYREIVAKFPNLFPTLFASEKDHKDWIKKAGL